MSRYNDTSNGTDYPDWIGSFILLIVFLWTIWTWFAGPSETEKQMSNPKTHTHYENHN